MKINLNTLYKPVVIDGYFEIPESFYEKTPIKRLENVYAVGKVYTNLSEEIEIDLDVKGVMILEDSITLDDIKHIFSFKIEEILDETNEEMQEYLKNSKNILDIIEILWENIVLEVPISLTNAKEKRLEGKGWSLNGEESKEEIDPRLAKLNDIFKGGE